MEIEHRYGSRVHIINDIVASTLLTDFCSPKTKPPRINQLCSLLYQTLFYAVANLEFASTEVEVPTRMSQRYKNIFLKSKIFLPEQKIIIVAIARAGLLPGQVCFDQATGLVNQANVRQDHFFSSRIINANKKVEGAKISGFKIGGGIENSLVLIPDPIGATGSTMRMVVDYYEAEVTGKPKKYLAIHLIITPEYLKKVLSLGEHFEIYALRVDRGLSLDKVLNSIPGTYWDEERGLSDDQFILPGCGGVGEIMNNAFV